MKIEERNAILREVARKFFPNSSPTSQAALLADELARYGTSSWLRRDRLLNVCPYEADTLRAYLWAALRAYSLAPSARSLRKILG